jgi:hypothetical protein
VREESRAQSADRRAPSCPAAEIGSSWQFVDLARAWPQTPKKDPVRGIQCMLSP